MRFIIFQCIRQQIRCRSAAVGGVRTAVPIFCLCINGNFYPFKAFKPAVFTEIGRTFAWNQLGSAIWNAAVCATVEIIVDVTNAVTNLWASSYALIPPVVHDRSSAASGFLILCAVGNGPVTIPENVIGQCDVVWTPQAIFGIQITVIRCIQPNKFANLISITIQFTYKGTVIHPDVPGGPNIDQNPILYIFCTEINIPNDNIITGIVTHITVFIVRTKHTVCNLIGTICSHNGLVIPDTGMIFFLHIQFTVHNNGHWLRAVQSRFEVRHGADDDCFPQQTADGASFFALCDLTIRSKSLQTITIQLELLIGCTRIGSR